MPATTQSGQRFEQCKCVRLRNLATHQLRNAEARPRWPISFVPGPRSWSLCLRLRMLRTPLAQGLDDGTEALSLVGERVLEPRRPLLVERAPHEPVVFH